MSLPSPGQAAGDPAEAPGPAEVLRLLDSGRQTLAVAESLTGGSLCAAFVAVPGASTVLRGGVVAYATDVKADLLGVDDDLLAGHGAVHPDVAVAMAQGVARRLGSTWGVATTGVAGPTPQDGQPVGTVHVAVSGPVAGVRSLLLAGDRAAVRAAAVGAAVDLLHQCATAAAGRPEPG